MIDEKKIYDEVDAEFPYMSPEGRDSVVRSRLSIAKNAGKLPELIKVDLGPNASRKVKRQLFTYPVSFDNVKLSIDELHGFVHGRLTANKEGVIEGTYKERKLEKLLAEAAEVAADLSAREALDKTDPE